MSWLNGFFKRLVGKPNEEENNFTTNNTLIDEQYLFDLEERLLRLDCGLEFSEYIVNQLRAKGGLTVSQAETEIINLCTQAFQQIHDSEPIIKKNKLNIILIVGVNGAGKTTSIGKLAYKFAKENLKVLIAPCDTFRAAAGEQLQKWAERANASFFPVKENAKADSVLYSAIQQAQKDKIDVLIVDTAGRLQNKKGLMDELAKLSQVINKHAPQENYTQRLLVIDATTGQNGYSQAALFNEVANLTGVILTKFDGSAKGGILFAINHNLKIPVKFLGIGEKIDQLLEFKPEDFVKELKIL